MQKPKTYNIQPSRGQALLNFQGRRYPEMIEVFETEVIDVIKQKKTSQLSLDKQKTINSDFKNLLIQSDCLSACAYLKKEDTKIDLVYIDPPFASGADYAKTLYLRTGEKSSIESEDSTLGEEIMYGDIWQKEDYLNWLYERLLAIREVMSETASIYVHIDWHIGHYVKILLDEVFGEENFKNEIIWGYRTGGTTPNAYARKHDTILFYTKSEKYLFNTQYYKSYQQKKYNFSEKYPEYFDEEKKMWYHNSVCRDVWEDIYPIGTEPGNSERTDYATQKPEALLKRIIEASSDEGMIVADFFIGSGTTAKVASDLGRKFVACDIGVNAIQNTRDRLVKARAELNILKVKDGVRLFRNPAQTTTKIFSLIDGFQTRIKLDLSEFWDGGIANKSGQYIPVKFVGIDKRLTKELLDNVLEEIYQLQDSSSDVVKAQLIYAYKDDEINQSYINKQISNAGKTTIKLELINLDELLASKRDLLYMPDSADIELSKEKDGYKVTIKRFFSPYLKTKIDDYNNKKVKKTKQTTIDEEQEPEQPEKKVTISDTGLELIEAVQFDTTLKKNIWTSNLELEDKAGVKEKIKGEYILPTSKFLMKIRNIAGDEIIIDSSELINSPKSRRGVI